MLATIKKWGNSASVRIPVSVMDAANLHLDSRIDVRAENGRIVIEPAPQDDLAHLLSRITPENLHSEASFGAARGKETL